MGKRHKAIAIPVALLTLVVVDALFSLPVLARDVHDQSIAAGRYYNSQRAPSKPAIMFKGYPYTDPDVSIYNYLIRTYREEGPG